jgi:solute carrier family 30 (zinc transporter), member 9
MNLVACWFCVRCDHEQRDKCLQDGAAVAGVIVAAACTMLVEHTGMLLWDGIGSVLVGLILGGVAIYLIQRNRSFLIGRSMKPEDFKKIVRHLKQDPVVKNIYEAKSEEIGEGIFRCVALITISASCQGRLPFNVPW